LCSLEGIVVISYVDDAEGEMIEGTTRGGKFVRTVLRPRIVLAADSDPERAKMLHRQAHASCFIANSVNFPVETEPTITVA
jgi:organic hydroperoxide reductase OsmC/OhrA